MISVEDCEFIKKFEVANSEEKQIILTNEGHQVSSLNIFFPFNGCLFMPDLQIVLGLLPNERKHTDQCVLFFFQCHAAFKGLFFGLVFFLVCKDLPEPDGSHLQGANSPVHPDFD